jgi:hypothetical protein
MIAWRKNSMPNILERAKSRVIKPREITFEQSPDTSTAKQKPKWGNRNEVA